MLVYQGSLAFNVQIQALTEMSVSLLWLELTLASSAGAITGVGDSVRKCNRSVYAEVK